jgi:hypothetical protein
VTERDDTSDAEIGATVARLEAKLAGSRRHSTVRLLMHYRALIARFGEDLPSQREQMISRGAVLMLIQASDRDEIDGE